MNREDIIRMAREVGLPHWYETEGVVNEELLIKFAALVASVEREEIIALAESSAFNRIRGEFSPTSNDLVNAIKARGQA